MLNKTLIFGKSEPKAGFVWLFVLVATLLFLQCSGEDPGNIVGPPYTPPELTNTTWKWLPTLNPWAGPPQNSKMLTNLPKIRKRQP